jgi:hypothetical protein
MVISVEGWLKASEERKEQSIKWHLRKLRNFEDSTKCLVDHLKKDYPKSSDLKVYNEVLEHIDKTKAEITMAEK